MILCFILNTEILYHFISDYGKDWTEDSGHKNVFQILFCEVNLFLYSLFSRRIGNILLQNLPEFLYVDLNAGHVVEYPDVFVSAGEEVLSVSRVQDLGQSLGVDPFYLPQTLSGSNTEPHYQNE